MHENINTSIRIPQYEYQNRERNSFDKNNFNFFEKKSWMFKNNVRHFRYFV